MLRDKHEIQKSELLSLNSGPMAKLMCSYKPLIQIILDINFRNLAIFDQNLCLTIIYDFNTYIWM